MNVFLCNFIYIVTLVSYGLIPYGSKVYTYYVTCNIYLYKYINRELGGDIYSLRRLIYTCIRARNIVSLKGDRDERTRDRGTVAEWDPQAGR